MNTQKAELVIRIHLINAQVEKYVVTDKDEALRILEQITPARFYDQKQIVIGCDEFLTAFQTSMVTYIELLTKEIPVWPLHFNLQVAAEVGEDRYRAWLAQPREEDKTAPQIFPPFSVHNLVSGENLYICVEPSADPRVKPLTAIDQQNFLKVLFTLGGFHIKCRGGVILENPANIVSITVHPGHAAEPQSIWHAQRQAVL